MKQDKRQREAVKRLWAERLKLASDAYALSKDLADSHQPTLERIGKEVAVPAKYVRRQFLLHCPRFELKQIRSRDFIKRESDMHDILFRRSVDYKLASNVYEPEVTVQETSRFFDHLGTASGNIHVEAVAPQQARLIEGQLHYMQSFRLNSTRRLGLYYGTDVWPFCYTAVAACDRTYVHKAIEEAIGHEVDIRRIAILSRIYASRNAPKNSISFLISRVMRMLRKEKFLLFVTASNPFLGFTAASLAGSNYVPFAHSPVAYNYDNMGLYRTRRSTRESTGPVWEAPRNFLYMKSLFPQLAKKVRLISNIVDVSKESHSEVEENTGLSPVDLERSVTDVRLSLEGIWGDKTRYHKTEYNPNHDPVSKGQCGVTSAYLARLLERQGHTVFFCEGDASFEGFDPITQHCWLILPKTPGIKKSSDDIVIDITADQSGYERAVICETVADLEKRGIHYNETYRISPSQVGVDHVKSRLKVLQNRLRGRNIQRG